MASPVEPSTTMPATGVARVALDIGLELFEIDAAVGIERRREWEEECREVTRIILTKKNPLALRYYPFRMQMLQRYALISPRCSAAIPLGGRANARSKRGDGRNPRRHGCPTNSLLVEP